ncbi:MAG: alpha/beta hydrolase [Bacteroidetes bacterium]|nr:alpha/beta hydrolase [Bacteroidota bacterium]
MKLIGSIVGFALFAAVPSFAQQTINIWPGLAPGTGDEKNKERIVNERIYDVYQPDMEVFLPKRIDANRPAVVICPGGGYNHLAIELEGTSVAKWLNENGIAAFVLKYRLKPDQAFEDAKRALSLLRSGAKKYGINPNLLGIAGFSAGGQVAAEVATHYKDAPSRVLVDGVSCKPDFVIFGYPALDWLHPDADEEYARLGSKASFVPYYHLVDKDTPPTFIVHAADDKTVPVIQSIQFFTALEKAGVPCELHVFEKGGHGFGLGDGRGAVDKWPGLCIEWMRTEGILKGE